MVTHSKGSYVAFRTGRYKLTSKEIAFRMRVAEECKKFCEEPFPNGAVISFDQYGDPL
jgi:hypothetical protein